MRYLVGKINRFCGLFLFFILVFILAALISFPLAMTVLASSSDAPDTVPTDGTYIEGTITPVDESSFSGETLAGMYPFSLSEAGLVGEHHVKPGTPPLLSGSRFIFCLCLYLIRGYFRRLQVFSEGDIPAHAAGKYSM